MIFVVSQIISISLTFTPQLHPPPKRELNKGVSEVYRLGF